MKNNRTELSRRVRHALLAGMAGAFLIPQVTFAAPTGENVTYGGATVTRSGNDTNINSGSLNNVIEWRDYSLTSTERVVHDGGAKTNNYLNIVTGANTSNINGKIEGGKDVYIVNPNGVIFGKSAEVNVGNLYVSTQEKSTLNQTAFTGSGASPLVDTAALKADVVNMGKITATSVEVHGSHIRFLNAADVTTDGTTAAPVKVYTDAPAASLAVADGGYAHIGYRGTAPTNYTAGNATSAAPEYYQLVANQSELNNINTNTTTLSGKYMLEQDIDFANGSHTPIGTTAKPFTGKFDGNFFQIKKFKANDTHRAGLFGEITNARIENLGVTGAKITGGDPDSEAAGGIAAYASGSLVKNVYVKDSEITSKMADGVTDGAAYVGGIVGVTTNTTIDSAYAKNRLGGYLGGIVGRTQTGSVISNSYNDSELLSAPGTKTFFLYIPGGTGTTTIVNSYNVGLNFASNKNRLIGGLNNVYELDPSTKLMAAVNPLSATPGLTGTPKSSTAAASYSGWSINNTGELGAKWRIYEGRTLPLLTAFMGVSSEATYGYRYFKGDGTASTAAGNTPKTNNGADMKDMEYNSHYVKIVDKNSPDAIGGKSNVKFGAGADASGIKDHVSGSDLDTTNGIRNVGTKAILWTDQDGPNLRGVNVEIKPRVVSLKNSSLSPSRMYNGKSDVTKAFRDALTSGGIGSTGFTAEDIANSSVTLDFTSGSFKAQAVDGSNNPDRKAGKNKPVKFSGTIGFSGPDAGNYEFDGSSLSNLTGSVTITKAPLYLSIQKKTADGKTYDGTSTVVDSAMLQTNTPPNITLDDTKTGLTLAQIDAGTPAMPDGAIMTGDDDTTKDNVSLTPVGGPKYTNAAGVEQFHAGEHKLQYTNVGLQGNDAGNYELYYTPANNTKTLVSTTDKTVYLDGKIVPREILRDNFNVYDKTTHAKVDAKKVYDGNDEYKPSSNVYISSNAVTGGTTGLVERDRDHITFALTGDKGHFAQNNGTTYSKNVQDVEKLAYEVTGHTDDDTNYKLSDYYIMDGGVQKSLGSTFHATGAGKITPKALTPTVKNNHITKVYDAMDDQTDGNRNITRGDELVTLDGFVTVNGVKESRTNTSTAKYASPNVLWDGVNNRATTQGVTYTASFDPGTGVESQNYTLGAEGVTPISTTKALTGSYTGTITPRPLGIKFADVTKVYDGTTNNPDKTITDIDDSVGVAGATKGAVTSVDGTTTASLSAAAMANITSTYNDANAGTGKTVTYTNLSGLLSNHNYSVADAQTGKGTITRRLIENSGFQVRKTGGTPADATKVYDGKTTFTLAGDEYLVAKPAATSAPDTGIVAKDVPNIVFKMTGNEGHFLKSGSGTAVSDRTTHVSEAARVAYDVYADTLDGTTSPLSNYEFGTTISKRNLEAVTAANPDAVTAAGRITPAKIQATTHEIAKLYDGVAEHTDGNRNVLSGDTIVGLNLFTDATGQPTNTSTAAYADRNVARDMYGNVIKKNVTYKAQLTGQYANDYQIVDAGNNVISTESGSGATRTVTATITPSAATGTINPRKLKITMNNVTKTYDGTAKNTSATVAGITDDPASTVINTILTNDGVSAGSLQTEYNNMLTANTASSSYGRLSGTFTTNANASNGTPHDVEYANMDNAFAAAFSAVADNYDVAENVYGKGTINRKAITPNTFKVSGGKATKVYDGTSAYTVPAGSTLTANTGELVGTDASKIQFAISGNGAKFMKTDGVTETANVADAHKVAYNITATGDADTLRNYTLNGQNLESGNLTASGDGEITRRALNLNLVQSTGIDKEYDGQTTLKNTATKNWNALTDADPKGNVQYAAGSTAANKLVTTDGTSFNITSNYMNNAGTTADKNVHRDGSNNPIDKTIQYRVTINGDANNYSFDGGTTSAAGGLTLSATGTITPKDLSGAFKKVTKVYDRTTNVPPSQVGFTPGAVISGDTVNLAAHTEAFQSPDVNGDGSTWTPTGGTAQKNWVNYSGLTLGGTDAGNYNLSSTARGLGEITPLALNPSNITFNIGQATKEYDGTTAVKHNNSAALTDVKNYITSATTTVNSTTVNVLPELSVDAATYDTKDVDGGRFANRVTYTLKYTGASGNFTIGSGTFTQQGNGVITKKDVTATVKSSVSKVYDATTTLTGVAKDSANAVVTNANDLIGMTGFTDNDGATYTTTAVYADKNVGTGKQVDYTLTLNGAAAGNYNLKYGGANSSGTFSTNDNTITKRKVDVTFADVTKTYDTTPTNTSITGTVSAADKTVLNTDSAGLVNGSNALTNLSTLNSQYGAGTGASFTANPNAGTNKDVRYQGLGAQMGATLGANAANYEFAADGYGKGTITRATINSSDVTFGTTNATKVYDGTQAVKHNGSAAMGDVKNYITNAMWNGHDILSEFAVSSAQYNTTANVNGGASQGVTYNMALTGANNNIQLGSGSFTARGTGVITPKDVDVTVKSPLTKVYDATTAVKDAGGNPITGSALNNLLTLTGLTNNDGATYTTTAQYADKNAGTGKQVNYTLTMNGAAADNYNLKRNGANIVGNAFSTNDNTITKRTVDVAFADVSKTYDTTPTNNSITPRVSSTDAAVLALDSSGNVSGRTITGLTGVTSQYGTGTTDATFAANPNAGTKSVQYAGIGAAMGTVFGTNNYEFAANGYGKGTINRATVNAGDVTFGTTNATKVYDGTRTVKHNENAAPGAVKNYITNAMWNGHDILSEFTVSSAQYNTTANVNGGASQGVTYNMALTGTNNNIQLGTGSFTANGTGVITPKDVDVTVKSQLTKVYDATTAVKDAGGNPITGNALNNLLTLTGLTGNDGATYTTTAQYANKNAGTGKQVNYTLTMNGAAADNYNLKYGGVNSSGSFSTNDNTITKRKVDVTFAPVTKTYDMTETNTSITGTVSAADKAVLNTDQAGIADGTNKLTNLGGLSSQYGMRSGATFTPDKNAGTNKDVRYQGLSAQMGTTLGANAGNYEFDADGFGKGTINRATINPGDVNFTVNPATKVYDGTKAVKHNENAAPSAVKNYITSAMWNGNNVLGAFDVDTAEYTNKNVNGGTPQNITYKMKLNGSNTNFQLGTTPLTASGTGVITPKDVKATVKSTLSKVYDGTTTVLGAAKNAAGNVVANANDLIKLDGLVNDGATNVSTAVYANKNAGTDNRTVNYTPAIDAAHAGNYRLVDGAGNAVTLPLATNNNTITKRKVDVTFDPVTKSYDGTAANNTIAPKVSADNAAVLALDSSGNVSGTTITNLTGVTSEYGTLSGTTFTPDKNVGTKTVRYNGVDAAMGTAFGANNYDFVTSDGTGTITKANINTSDITFTTTGAHKVYDGTRTVKYNGSGASDQVKNYITQATANLGGGHTADLRGDLEIDTAGTKYASSNAGTGIGVTYKFRLNNNNIEISGRNEFEMTDTGTIDRRVLNLDLTQKTGIDKIYDANEKLVNTNTRKYDKFTDDDALGNVTYAAGTTNDNKLVRTSNGASVNDGAAMTIRANYVNAGVADKNVARDGSGNVAAKDIAYRVSIDAANGGQNYKLSDGVTTVDAETGLNLSARGTITPRGLTLGFADVSKPYDTTAVNNAKNINSIVAADSDGRGAATLTADNITNATFNMTNVRSFYGAGNTDATFQSDPNVVTDADGSVVPNGKDVQYTNIRSALSGTNANNYTVANTAYGKGTIRKRVVSVNDFDFNISKATKMYDGTGTVYWHDNAGNSYSDLGHVKQYFRGSTLDLGGGNTVPINLDDIELNSAKYKSVDASPSTGIEYGVRINAKNFEFNGGNDRTIHHTGDEITKRNLATMLPKHLVKEYDGEQTFTETNTAFANAMARENLTPIVERDRGLVHLAVAGQYDDKHASAETRAEAEARTPATAGKNVTYALTLSGDASRLTNYEIDGQPLTNAVAGKADIYKKTLTVGVDNIDKLYDGTRTVVRPNGTGTLPHPEAGKFRLSGFVGSESFGFDQTAADKIDGLYSDPNVSRRNGAVVDKDIAYSGLQNAFADNATRDTTGYARNYRIDGDTLSGKGKINPRPITANEITSGLTFDEATKVYDGTRAVKYNGQNTPDALKNYLTSATVNVDGTPIDIRNDLTIRADEAYTHYDTQHVAGGAQPRVTYGLSYTGGNFDISGDLTKTANGVITKRKVMAYAPGQLTKVYDASPKVYDPLDDSIKTYRHGTRVTDGDSIVRMSTEDGDTGLLANDGVRNISTATFDDKNVGKRKKVTYNVAVDSTHAGDYEIVDTLGNTISELTTRNNEITPRRLDLTFGDASKFYDATSTNDDTPTTFVTDSDTRKTLQKDHARIFGNKLLLQDGAGNDLTLPSDYGYGRTDRTFTPDANADKDKSVQYRNMGDALRTILGDNAKNYEFDETGYGKGTIKQANVRESDFDFRFNDAEKEYDGTSAVADAMSHLDKGTSRVRLPRSAGWKNYNLPDTDIAGVTGTYMSADGRTPDKNAADRKIVNYKVQLNDRNFFFEGGWNGVVEGEGRGKIERRAITAAQLPYLTKTYDGTNAVVNAARDAEGNLITGSGDALMQFRHVGDATQSALIAGDDVTNATTATYGDANVAWKDDAWKNGHGDVADKDVNYTLTLSGADAANYKIVDSNGNEVSSTVGKGRIDPKDIHLKSDPQTRWINEGLPNSYTGTPSGSNYETGVNGEVLPGEIYYDSPNGKLRWGDYAINGYYRASKDPKYQRPDGSTYHLADEDKTPDGDSVARNYRFVQDPANDKNFHMGPYIPDYEYYKALTQASKMIPDEYAYENASLDRRSHFGRDPEAEISYTPPSVNTIKDGVDITQTGIHVQDETVFTLMNEVFGGK